VTTAPFAGSTKNTRLAGAEGAVAQPTAKSTAAANNKVRRIIGTSPELLGVKNIEIEVYS
jgi:hypothetical protein